MELWHVLFWAVLTVLLIVAEVATVQMVAVWFAAGSLVAFVCSLFGVPFSVQVIVFILGSVLLLAATRPIVKKLLRGMKKEKVNADRVIGQECIVKEEINNLSGTGRVFADGLDWTARSMDDSVVYPAGMVCEVVKMEGVKLFVTASQK